MSSGKHDLKKEFEELRKERAERAERGTLPREIDRHHKFPFNENPHDNDAHPDSGWLYAKDGWEVVGAPAAGPLIVPSAGPESGIPCMKDCGRILRIVDEKAPGEMLSFLSGNEEKNVVVEGDVSILILLCVCGAPPVQFRSDMLPNKPPALLLP